MDETVLLSAVGKIGTLTRGHLVETLTERLRL